MSLEHDDEIIAESPSEDSTIEINTVSNDSVTRKRSALEYAECQTEATEIHFSKENVEYKVIIAFDDSYLKTGPGVIKIALTVISIIALICITSSGRFPGEYLLLPCSWRLRMFVFVSVSCFLTSFSLIFLQVTGLIRMFQFNWHFVDLVVFAWFFCTYLFASALITSSVTNYQIMKPPLHAWTVEQLLVGVILGYICACLCGASALNGYKKWHGSSQFRRFRLKELERLDRLQNSIETV